MTKTFFAELCSRGQDDVQPQLVGQHHPYATRLHMPLWSGWAEYDYHRNLRTFRHAILGQAGMLPRATNLLEPL